MKSFVPPMIAAMQKRVMGFLTVKLHPYWKSDQAHVAASACLAVAPKNSMFINISTCLRTRAKPG